MLRTTPQTHTPYPPNTPPPIPRPRLAYLMSGLGQVDRGAEAVSRSLIRHLRTTFDITVFAATPFIPPSHAPFHLHTSRMPTATWSCTRAFTTFDHWADQIVVMAVLITENEAGRLHAALRSAGHLHHPLVHYNSAALQEFLRKSAQFEALEAQHRHAAGRRSTPAHLVIAPLRVFLFRLLVLRGYRDGRFGWLLAAVPAYSTLRLHRSIRRLGATAGPVPCPGGQSC